MKYTIHGFSQKKAIEYELDYIDLLILRYFVDFKDTGKMSIKIENDKPFYWFKYDGFINEYPILKIKKDTVYRRMKQLVKGGFLKHITVKKNGTYSYFSVTEKILILLSDENKSINTDLNPTGYGNTSVGGTDLNPEQNNQSTKINQSTKYIYNHWNSKNIINHKELTKETEKVINKTIKIYTKDEIIQAIDMYKEILDSDFYFNYKWSLKDFLNRKNGISTFLEDGSNLINYKEWRKKSNGANRNGGVGQDIKSKRFNIKIESNNELSDEERERAARELI